MFNGKPRWIRPRGLMLAPSLHQPSYLGNARKMVKITYFCNFEIDLLHDLTSLDDLHTYMRAPGGARLRLFLSHSPQKLQQKNNTNPQTHVTPDTTHPDWRVLLPARTFRRFWMLLESVEWYQSLNLFVPRLTVTKLSSMHFWSMHGPEDGPLVHNDLGREPRKARFR